MIKSKKLLLAACTLLGGMTQAVQAKNVTFRTDYFGVEVNDRGYIVNMYDRSKPDRNFSPADRPSPLLSLYDSRLKRYVYPAEGRYDKKKKAYILKYPNGSSAYVRVEPKKAYIKLTLDRLTNRDDIGAVQWGHYYTNITNLLGEIIGVARDTTSAVQYAIGVLALDDNTIGGEAHYTSETGAGGYIAHTPDPVAHPLPLTLHEGQQFTMGGDGISDVAFYNRREPYYRMLYGQAAGVDANGRINIRYQARDRRKPSLIYSPEGVPVFQNNEPNHLMRQAVPGVDYIGSSVAFWGSPDSIALTGVIRSIVKGEGLPYPEFDGKWVKDPTSFMPDVNTYGGRYDSIASYVKQMGLRVVHAYDQGFLRANRANHGYIDGKDGQRRTFSVGGRKLSHREYADLLARDGIMLGRTCITNSMAPGTADCSPVPTDSVCVQHRRRLTADLSPEDTLIYIDDPTYLNEIACWEGHCKELNMVKIGKELIHYLGVSDKAPYTLLNVTRGYWNTKPATHCSGDAVDKVQVTVGWGYQGMVPNLELQDEIARHYGEVAARSGVTFLDFDGQEFLFHSGFGSYSVKRFFRSLWDRARELGVPYMRFTGATLSEGSWHYQSIWNVGGGTNMYDADKRMWGSSTSQGKDLRDVTYANFFPSSFGANFPIKANSTVEQYEHIEATAVGYGTTYSLRIGQNDVESCPQKYAIFEAIRTWEEARRADAFPEAVRRRLQDPSLSWRLRRNDEGGWTLMRLENGLPCERIALKPRINELKK